MGNFQGRGNRGGGFRGGNSSGHQSFSGNRGGDRREVTMHNAVCDECNKDCQVPFRPSNDKPIYCNDCFSNKRDDQPRREFNDHKSKRSFGGESNSIFKKSSPIRDDTKNQLREINVKLDRLASAIEKLTIPKVDIKSLVKPVENKKSTLKKVLVPKKSIIKKKVTKKISAKVTIKKKIIKKTPVKKTKIKKIIKKTKKK